MKTTTIPTALLAIAVTFAASACGGGSNPSRAEGASVRPTTTTTIGQSTVTSLVGRPSRLVDKTVRIDSGRLHLRCVGSGSTTVVLIAGWGEGGSVSWGGVQPTIAERSRVCSYDRFGTGTSDAPATTQTFATQAADLHALLAEAGEPGPYVVAGHSFGGAEAVVFASRYRDEVVGLMLLDASPPTWPAALCEVRDDGQTAPAFQTICAVFRDPSRDAERLDVFPAFDEVAAISSLNDLPMTVMTAAQRMMPGLAEPELSRLSAVWNDGVGRWAALSTASTVVSVEDTGHHIQRDQPDFVVREVLKLIP